MYCGLLSQGQAIFDSKVAEGCLLRASSSTFAWYGLNCCSVACQAVAMPHGKQIVALPEQPFGRLQPLALWKRVEPSGSVCLE